MSEPKHTPGPWRADLTQPSRNHDGDLITDIRSCDRFACCLVQASTKSREEAEANAQLIATAPELLAHMKLATDPKAFETWGPEQWEEWNFQALMLISRAEGRPDWTHIEAGKEVER